MASKIHQWIQVANDEGRQEGELQLIARQLTVKFGPLSSAHAQYLQSLTSDQLLELGDRLLVAKSIAELFSDSAH